MNSKLCAGNKRDNEDFASRYERQRNDAAKEMSEITTSLAKLLEALKILTKDIDKSNAQLGTSSGTAYLNAVEEFCGKSGKGSKKKHGSKNHEKNAGNKTVKKSSYKSENSVGKRNDKSTEKSVEKGTSKKTEISSEQKSQKNNVSGKISEMKSVKKMDNKEEKKLEKPSEKKNEKKIQKPLMKKSRVAVYIKPLPARQLTQSPNIAKLRKMPPPVKAPVKKAPAKKYPIEKKKNDQKSPKDPKAEQQKDAKVLLPSKIPRPTLNSNELKSRK